MMSKSKGLVFPITYLNNQAILDLSLKYSHEFDELVSHKKNPISTRKAKRRERALSVDDLNPIKMLPLMYEFILALTPLALIKAVVRDFFTWKDPKKTLLISLTISAGLLMHKNLLAISLIAFFVFSKKIIPIVIQVKPLRDEVTSSVEKYKRNAVIMRVIASYKSLLNP